MTSTASCLATGSPPECCWNGSAPARAAGPSLSLCCWPAGFRTTAGRRSSLTSGATFIRPRRRLGLSLPRTIVVQPLRAGDGLWAWEQSLRSPAVAAVVGEIGKINDRVFRRLQLAAEASGSLGFLVRPASCEREPSWAAARLLVEAVSDPHLSAPARRFRLTVLHGRQGGGKTIDVELSDEANALHLVSPVADSAPPRRAAGA